MRLNVAEKIASLAAEEAAAVEAGDEDRAGRLFDRMINHVSSLSTRRAKSLADVKIKGAALKAITGGEACCLAEPAIASLALSIVQDLQRIDA